MDTVAEPGNGFVTRGRRGLTIVSFSLAALMGVAALLSVPIASVTPRSGSS